MKKYIVLLAGLISFCTFAQSATSVPIKHHKWWQDTSNELKRTVNFDNCYTTFWVGSTFNSTYKAMRVYERQGNQWVLLSSEKTSSYAVRDQYVGEHIYVVVVGERNMMAPPAHAPEIHAPQVTQANGHVDELTINDMPSPDLSAIYQYDVYYCKAQYYTMTHYLDETADLFTKTYTFDDENTPEDERLISWAGRKALYVTDKYYCGDQMFCVIKKGPENNLKMVQSLTTKALVLPYTVTLSPGNYEYWIYSCSRGGADTTWCDHYYITIDEPKCLSGMVYRKWDDLMFVDNGMNGGDGQFVKYQWMNQDGPIPGATKQWYRSSIYEDGKDPSGLYYVQCFYEDGTSMFTCPKNFYDLPASTRSNSHGFIGAPAHKELQNGQLIIELDGVKYNAQGMKIQ